MPQDHEIFCLYVYICHSNNSKVTAVDKSWYISDDSGWIRNHKNNPLQYYIAHQVVSNNPEIVKYFRGQEVI